MKKLLLLAGFFSLTSHNKAQTVNDVDGNTYNIVTIGTQVWMKENLNVTRYNNGSNIPKIVDSVTWYNLTTPGYCWYNNDSTKYSNSYGALYNWYTINTGNLCPSGWHVPNFTEWTTLIDYLGGTVLANYKLKETGATHWNSPNTGATNESGFTALPGGGRTDSGKFVSIGTHSLWWSTTEDNYNIEAWILYLYNIDNFVYNTFIDKRFGFSVRCIGNFNTTISKSKHSDAEIFYPNPAVDKLHLKNCNYPNSLIRIYDLQGKQVLIKKIESNPIDISNLKKGIYIIKFVNSKNVMISTLIKE